MSYKDKIWLSSPHMSDEGYEKTYVDEAFKSNWIAPLGPNVNEFERELAELVRTKHAAALSSGTAALHLALKALDVKQDDIVLFQTLTFSATANPILYEKATPVFIDSELETWNMDPQALETALIKYGSKVKAIMLVHLYGLSAQLDKIMELSKKYNVPVIEDAAEALGTYYKGQQVGTFGEIGVFSFNGNKIITTSGGGMAISNNQSIIEKMRFWATQSRDKARHYQHSEIGYNYRMSNVCAGIGRGQLKVLKQRVDKKNEIYAYYKEHLKGLEGLHFMPENNYDQSNRWLSVITLDGKVSPLDVMIALENENIESRPVWKPMHMQPIFEGYDYIGGTVAQNLFESGVCLPSDSKITEEQLKRVVAVIKSLWD